MPSPPGPLAVCDRLQILSANETAQAAGVHDGSRRATAQALLPEIELITHDPVREQQALTALACWALQFTPSVGFAPPPLPALKSLRARSRASHSGAVSATSHPVDEPTAAGTASAPLPEPGRAGLLLEVAASLRLFGGLNALLERMQHGLEALGYRARIGVAPTCHGAWLIARSHQAFPGRARINAEPDEAGSTDHLQQRLSSLPVGLLDQALAHLPALQAIGAHTIGQLLQLPRAGLARRFGKALLLEVDAALGSQPAPLDCFEAPERFATRIELMADVESAEALLFAARRLIAELTGWLAARQAGVRRFDLILEHNTPPRTPLSVRLTDASRDPERLAGLLRERLGIVQLRTSVHTLHLQCDRIQSLAPTSDPLFAEHRNKTHESLGRLLERLQVRLGRQQVQRLHLAADHRPEAAYRVRIVDSLRDIGRAEPASQKYRANIDRTNTDVSAALIAAEPLLSGESFCAQTGLLPRPLWLLREPMPLAERNNRPWLHSALNVLAGPERIETGWWDNHLIQRDYFVAEDDSSTLYWIYRERNRGWFVHGRFG